MCSAEQQPLARTAGGWICTLFERAGLPADMGWRLPRVFVAAGLPAPQLAARTALGSGPGSGAYALLADTIRTLLPKLEGAGVVSAEEVDIETLADRLRDETVAADALIILPTLASARTRSPGPIWARIAGVAFATITSRRRLRRAATTHAG